MWFDGQRRFAFLELRELAEEANSATPSVLLPSFQRDAVWDEARVELLWDSLLRGFPIGAVLLAKRPAELAGRRLQRSRAEAGRPTEEVDAELVLIDGQQRVTSIAMGFRPWSPGDPCRLWVDLAGKSEPGGARFRFCLCTVAHPWGRKATTAQRRHALAELPEDAVQEDGEVALGHTWPVRARAPVPLAELMERLARGDTEWADLLPPSRASVGSDPSVQRAAAGVIAALQGLEGYGVPALLLEELESVDDLGAAFQRLNRQGVSMTADDLFFSGLKLHWPAAHDLVWEIYGDERTGRFLRPTKIVHLATRLTSRLRSKRGRDVVRLDLDAFRKLIEAGDDGFVRGMQHFLSRGDEGRGRLHEYLRAAKGALVFRSATGDGRPDPGLPLPMLRHVRWRVWHTLVAWLAARGSAEIDEASRLEMIRYALLDHFFTGRNAHGLLRSTFELALGSPACFPGEAIFERIRADGFVAPSLMTPAQYESSLFDERGEPVGAILWHDRSLVMYAQRSTVARWYPRFDPTRYARAEDLPYDLDHLLAWAHLDRRGRKGAPLAEGFYGVRNHIGNGIGNLRVWPRGENRSDRDRPLEKKHLLGPADGQLPADSSLRRAPYDLETYGDVREASFLPEEDLGLWRRLAKAEGGNHDWSDPARLRAMRDAMTRRRVAMCRVMFSDAGFARWLSA